MTRPTVALVLTLANLALLVLLLAQGGITQARQDAEPVLRAERIELVDARGGVRAQLNTEDDGTVVLRLRDQEGNIRVKLGANAQGSGLALLDDHTEPGLHLLSGISTVSGRRETGITLAEPGGAKRVIRAGEAR